MSKIIYDTTAMQVIARFSKITRAKVKDCVISENKVLFIVEPGEIGKALGPKGKNVKRLSLEFKRKIKVVEFSYEPISFIKNLVHPLEVKDITEQDGEFTIFPADIKTRGLLIGRNAQSLRNLESIVKRHFAIKELKVK